MEFGQPMTDTLVNVSCKFEMYIFKIAQVINENVRIAFLYVRPAISPDLGRRLSAFSLHCRLTGFEVHFTGEIENLLAFFFQIDYFIIYGNQISIRYFRS